MNRPRAIHALTQAALAALLCALAWQAWSAWQSAPPWLRDPAYWWRTPDQRGADALAQGNFAAAARHFQRADWRGVACYRAGDFTCADAAFALAGGATAWQAEAAFNRGNVAARAGRLPQALAHFDAALLARPDWREARENRALVAAAIAAERKAEKPRDGAGEPALPPDGVVVDEQGKRGKAGRIEIEALDDAASQAIWLRNVKNDPAAFLRLRFADEARRAKALEAAQ